MHLTPIFTHSGTQRTSAHLYLHLSRLSSDGSGPVLATAGGSHPLVCEPPPRKRPKQIRRQVLTRMTGELMCVGFWWLPCCTEAAHPRQVSQTSNWPTKLCKGCSTLARMGAEPNSTRNCWTCVAWFTSPRMGVQPSSTHNFWM